MSKKMTVILILGAMGALAALWATGCGTTATSFTVHSSYATS